MCQRKSKGEVDTSNNSSGSEKEEEEEPVPTTPNGRPIRKRRKTSNFTPAAAAATANDDDDSAVSSTPDSDEDDNFKPPPGEEEDSESDEDFDEDDTKSKKKKKGTTATTKRKKRQSAPASLKSSSSNKANKKFGKLKPGTKFITNYGIVEVIADNRVPSNYNNKSTIDEVASRNFHKRKQRYNDRYQLMTDNIAVGQRYRREELKKIYLSSKDGGTNNNNVQQQQKQVWELYCKSFTPTQILKEGLSARKLNVKGSNEIESVKESFDNVDPRYPKDRYPDRIVECKLVEDTREVIIGSVSSSESSGGGDAVPEYHVKEEKVKSKERKVVPMRLYIARKDLIKEFGSSDTNYVCNNCGKDYPFREGLKYHLTTRACGTVKKSAEKKERDDRIVSIENKALSSSGGESNAAAAAAARDTLLTSLHGALKLQERVSLQKRPAGFGNPHKIKEFKKHKMPPWLVFNDDRSSMYPEIYVTLGFKRGSQNRNWATKKRLEDGYVPRWEQKKDYKKRKRMSLDHHHTDTKPTPVLSTQVTSTATAGSAALASTTAKSSTMPKSKSTQKKKPSAKQKKTKKQPAKEKTKKGPHPHELLPSEPPALPPLPTITNPDDVVMDVDFGGGNDDLIFETSDTMLTEEVPAEESPKKMAATVPQPTMKKAAAPPPPSQKPPAADAPQASTSMPPPASKKKDATKAPPAVTTKGGNNKRKATTAASAASSSTTTSKKSRKKGITINKKKDCVVIDTQVLATECESGRYPTINRYYGLHEAQCTICKKDDDDGTPLIHCDFCKNSCHQLCIDKRMLLKDPQVIIRENEPDDTPMCNECISTCLFRRWRAESRRITKWQHELAKAGLGNVPEAAGLTEEVNLKGGKGTNDIQTEDDDTPTYKPCPDGGPGGLICCSYCTASYSRFLSNTAKEMEAQSVSRVGQEVSEILELLADAKQRLQRASDVSQSNDDRRGLLDTNQSAHGGLSIDS